MGLGAWSEETSATCFLALSGLCDFRPRSVNNQGSWRDCMVSPSTSIPGRSGPQDLVNGLS